ncbi:lipase [Paraliobacillus quinghaiensis]|uniref:Lipase n=1 Tax=Paraliobacillus quinghaiensis TaxID=470815 RepID=A0A917WWN8_9BACI|nr:SGNH/GDSL hydrolase family protein [Paraliobacillus quinghaiensis]GGM39702.1 lipase [Paraliobacillus quinghaiensis]
MRFKEKDKIILIGDSITDAGRRRDPDQIGEGYFQLLRDYYVTTYPKMKLNFINKGTDGNRVCDLQDRWTEDIIDQQPDWISISIGINDVWRRLDNPDIEQIYPEDFLSIYTELLIRVKEETNAQIILMEPTIIEENIESKGNQLLVPYVNIVQDLAKQFDTVLVPTHQVFRKFLEVNPGYSVTTDGVHMTSTGNMLLMKTWIKAINS